MKDIFQKSIDYVNSKHYTYILYFNEDGQPGRWKDSYDEKEVIDLLKVVIEKKGFFRGANGTQTKRGKYLSKSDLIEILQSRPDWIKIKMTSNKFGL